jgi:hypothetical protein
VIAPERPGFAMLAAGLLAAGMLALALLFSGSSAGQGGRLHMGNASPYPDLAGASKPNRLRAGRLHRATLRASRRFDSLRKARKRGYTLRGQARRPGLRRLARSGGGGGAALKPRRPRGLVFWCPARGECQLAAHVYRAPAGSIPPTLGGLLGWHRQSRRAPWSTRVWLTRATRTALAQCVPFAALHARNANLSRQAYRAAIPKLDAPCRASGGAPRPGPVDPPGGPPGTAPRSSNCMPQPSACGFPDATNTGVPPGTPLTRRDGTVVLNTPGMTFSNVELHGNIEVRAPNVTIERVRVICGCWYPIRADGSDDASNTLIRDVEIDFQGFESGKGIAFRDYTAQRIWFHNGMDCAHFGSNVTITDSFCDLTKIPPGSEAHPDGFQHAGARNVVIRHNTIRNPNSQTAAILLPTDEAFNNIVVDNNLMSGGGWTLYCGRSGAENETITNNRFSREFWPRSGYWGPMSSCEQAQRSGNVWDDTGARIGP